MFRINWGNGQVSEVFYKFEYALRELTARIGDAYWEFYFLEAKNYDGEWQYCPRQR